ncbi:MAG: ComEC/Rec2 family competence protein [Candidatus Sabulitectum sp.]|nr:ComEC/Rec2 family competence protein [Candidatus Sabulitectum sp.]
MELSNRLLLILFAVLSILLIVREEESVCSGTTSHGVWRGQLTTVTARGGMISTENGHFWVSHKSLAMLSLKGDSLIVFGRRSGMFISPLSIRLKSSPSLISHIRRQLKARLLSTIHDPVSMGLTGGLLMGFRGVIPVGAAIAFKQSGTSHLLALSGLHTGIIALVLLFSARMLFGKGILSGLLAVFGIILFVALSGGRASTVRAGIMASFAVLWMSFRGGKLHLLTVWWAALILSLIFLPGTLEDRGAQMSYGAVLSLIVFGRNLRGRHSAMYSPMYAGVVVTVSLAPLMISVYGGVSWLGPVATVISLPFMLSVMVLGFLSFIGIPGVVLLLEPLSHFWVAVLEVLGHEPVCFPNYILYPVWGILLLGLRVFSRWNRFNLRFR